MPIFSKQPSIFFIGIKKWMRPNVELSTNVSTHLELELLSITEKQTHRPQAVPNTTRSTRTHVNKSSCRQVYKKRNNLGTFRKNFEVRYLEPVYNFSATLLQRNSLKYDEQRVEWCISCLTHREVTLVILLVFTGFAKYFRNILTGVH